MYKNSTPTSSFQRRKYPRDADTEFPGQTSARADRSSSSLLVISSEAPSLTINNADDVDVEAAKNPVLFPFKCTRGLKSSGCYVGKELGLVVDLTCAMVRNVDDCLVNESSSSSKSDMDLFAPTIKTEGDDTGECSSSEAFINKSLCDDLSGKDIRNLVIRILGLHRGVNCIGTSVSPKVPGSNSECSCMRPCKVCDQPEITLKMLICDQCEEAYHIRCCYPRRRKLPRNEWFCHCCKKKKHKIPELTAKGSPSYNSEVRKGRTAISRGALGPIAAMLEDGKPYTPSVRIGLEFQAEVPNWSGPLTNEDDYFNELLEMSPTDGFQEGNSRKPSKPGSISNWLQCQTIISGTGEGVDGTVCGKWRRAPLFEVQSRKWECFHSVQWDPAHADCAVPQEVETDRVLKDLKYLEMLKPRLVASKRKLDSDDPDD
ncbi:transcription intermediary factor 1-alpha [Heracleum sosnowskyi]|uniref:Transcription intermediary factor 1-alpha n=1 Tax=Heracleum sosnowskyi TaxID=360622 RepID=A0AAD8JC92_9APIA|nr:transcription intermediary factor 1-alpha [Heracleum sosnowskyi]